jgi:hypothetical protein
VLGRHDRAEGCWILETWYRDSYLEPLKSFLTIFSLDHVFRPGILCAGNLSPFQLNHPGFVGEPLV